MTEKHKALGRGLETLLPPRQHPFMPLIAGGGKATEAEAVLQIPLEQLDANPYQTRTQLDEKALDELCESIAVLGVLEPILVRPSANGRYQVVAGERRVKASYMCEKYTIPAVVRQMSDQQAMEMTVVENLLREDLSILDQARAYLRLSKDFALTQDDIAQRTGKDRSTVANYLRLLKLLPEEVQRLVDKGDLSFGHAKVLMTMPGSSASLMEELARKIIRKGLTVRQTEEAVAKMMEQRPAARKERIVDPNVRAAEETLRHALGVEVRIKDHKWPREHRADLPDAGGLRPHRGDGGGEVKRQGLGARG
jgi:ParB family chromosome partitioning protein